MITDALEAPCPPGLRPILGPYHLAGFKHLITRACALGKYHTIDPGSLHTALKDCQLCHYSNIVTFRSTKCRFVRVLHTSR
jgi:ferredoxin-like protein FixX